MDITELKLTLEPPRFPNYVTFKTEGRKGELTVDIGALSEKSLNDYAEAWKQGLLAHAKARRERVA